VVSDGGGGFAGVAKAGTGWIFQSAYVMGRGRQNVPLGCMLSGVEAVAGGKQTRSIANQCVTEAASSSI